MSNEAAVILHPSAAMKTLVKFPGPLVAALIALQSIHAIDSMPPVPPRLTPLQYPDSPIASWTLEQNTCYENLRSIERQRAALQNQIKAADDMLGAQARASSKMRDHGEEQSGKAGAMGMQPGAFAGGGARHGGGATAEQGQTAAGRHARLDALDKEFDAALTVFTASTHWVDPLAGQISAWRTWFDARSRTWKDLGNRELVAMLIAHDATKVTLMTIRGQRFTLPLKMLVAEDRAFVVGAPK